MTQTGWYPASLGGMMTKLLNLFRREPLGELMPIERYTHDGWVATVAHEMRVDNHGRAKFDWVVVEEWDDGQSTFQRLPDQMAATIFATDGQAMRP